MTTTIVIETMTSTKVKPFDLRKINWVSLTDPINKAIALSSLFFLSMRKKQIVFFLRYCPDNRRAVIMNGSNQIGQSDAAAFKLRW